MASNSIVVNTILNTAGFNRGAANMRNSIFSLSGTISKLGMLIAGAFSATALINFGKSAIELGSDLAEVQNVVDVTFGNMSSAIDEFAQNAITQFGLSEKSAKQYASTMGAMLKSMGLEQGQAYEMSTMLTGLAGDIASFYNLTSDEAFSKIRSGISGETEPLKQLGINLSVANLEAFALAQGITKSYNAMTEQEKVMLRYNYLLKTTADAQGDFERTSEGRANQTRILSEQFNSLKATIGQGLINVFTPVVKWLNTIIAKLKTVANGFKELTEYLFGSQETKNATDALTDIEQGYDDITTATEEATEAQKTNLSGLEELNVLGKADDGSAASTITGGVESSENVGNVEDNTKATKEKVDIIEKLIEKINELRQEYTILDDFFGILESKVTNAKELLKDLFDFFTKPFVENKENFLFAGENILEILKENLETVLSGFRKASEYFGEVYNSRIKPVIQNITSGISDLVGKALNWFNQDLKPMFDRWGEKFEELWDSHILPFLNKFSEFIADVAENIGYLWDEFISPLFNWILDNIMPKLIPIIEFVGNKFMESIGVVSDVLGNLLDSLSGVLQFITSVFVGDWERAWDGIKNAFSSVINACKTIFGGFVEFIGSSINFIFESIDSVIKKIKSSFGDESVTGAIGGLSGIVTNSVNVPMLATGAVIPPNAPFMAMLGDQKNGTNIETPESLLRQIVREEMSGINITFAVEGDPYGMFKVTQKQANDYYNRTKKPPYPT